LAHASANAGRRPAQVQGQATGLRDPMRRDLPVCDIGLLSPGQSR
jgi:hypothetical protein